MYLYRKYRKTHATVSYIYMRKHLCEIMERTTNSEQICFTRKGQEPLLSLELAHLLKPNLKKQNIRNVLRQLPN